MPLHFGEGEVSVFSGESGELQQSAPRYHHRLPEVSVFSGESGELQQLAEWLIDVLTRQVSVFSGESGELQPLIAYRLSLRPMRFQYSLANLGSCNPNLLGCCVWDIGEVSVFSGESGELQL